MSDPKPPCEWRHKPDGPQCGKPARLYGLTYVGGYIGHACLQHAGPEQVETLVRTLERRVAAYREHFGPLPRAPRAETIHERMRKRDLRSL